MKKKGYALSLFCILLIFALCACGAQADNISLVTREEGSGTRSAFAELVGAVSSSGADAIPPSAEVTNSSAVMISSVAGYRGAIGYVSVGSLSGDVRALTVDGVAATAENVQNGTYPVARRFELITKGTPDALTGDFLAFLLSAEGQQVVKEKGYVSVGSTAGYTGGGVSGTLRVAGSTSVAPVLEAAAERYHALNPAVQVEIQQSGSSAGIRSVTEGVASLGMSSRALTESERASGLCATTMALDGIAVIVSSENPLEGLTLSQVGGIFCGELTRWSALE